MISICKEKAFDKIYYPFIIRILNKRDIQGMHLSIKVIYNKRTANIIFKGKEVMAFPLRSETSQGCPQSPLLFNIIVEVLDTAVAKIKSIQI